MKRLAIVCISVCAAALLAACSSGAPSPASTSSSSAAEPTASESAASAASAESAASAASAAAQPDRVTVGLERSAGAGFEWTCAIEPEGVVEQTGQTTASLSQDRDISGGPLRDDFTFRATAPGEAVLTFELARSWEDAEPAETKVYAFTVTDSLEMVLNPYKSQFDIEPEWN